MGPGIVAALHTSNHLRKRVIHDTYFCFDRCGGEEQLLVAVHYRSYLAGMNSSFGYCTVEVDEAVSACFIP